MLWVLYFKRGRQLAKRQDERGYALFSLLGKSKVQKDSDLTTAAILIIEDSKADRMLIQRTLEKKNYAVFTAPDGESGLELIQKYKIDLIILDYLLPGVNGIKVCEILKTDVRTKDIPVIFLTVVEGGGEIIGFYEVGAEVYLHKPIDGKHLLKEVTALLAESKSQ